MVADVAKVRTNKNTILRFRNYNWNQYGLWLLGSFLLLCKVARCCSGEGSCVLMVLQPWTMPMVCPCCCCCSWIVALLAFFGVTAVATLQCYPGSSCDSFYYCVTIPCNHFKAVLVIPCGLLVDTTHQSLNSLKITTKQRYLLFTYSLIMKVGKLAWLQ